jgi:hypothetical protein
MRAPNPAHAGLLEGDGVAGTGAGGAGGAPGSPSEGMVGALKKAVSPPVKQSGVAMLSWQQQPAGSHVGPLAGAHVMGAATMGVAQGANQPALAVGGMHGSYAGYASFAREPVVPGGLPASATSSYPSALPVKPMTNKSHGETSADPHAGGRLQVQLEPHAAGYWFRQKKFWADLDDATPSQAKSTYPQDVVCETSCRVRAFHACTWRVGVLALHVPSQCRVSDATCWRRCGTCMRPPPCGLPAA